MASHDLKVLSRSSREHSETGFESEPRYLKTKHSQICK
jgi:hypothetical protein